MPSEVDANSREGECRPSLRWLRQCVATDAALGLSSVPLGVLPVASTAPTAAWVEPREMRPASSGDPSTERRREVAAASPVRAPASTPAPETLLPVAARPAAAIPRLHSGVDLATLTSSAAKQAALEALRDRHDRECPHCTTATYHARTVFGEGSCDAELMFVGEAPGETEDQLGRPFVGKAGHKLDEMITAMGFARAEVYIANVLKSRPPENRTPLQHEVERCGPYLIEQIRIVRPRVIVTLGGPATKLLLATELGITRLRGIWASLELPEIDPAEAAAHPRHADGQGGTGDSSPIGLAIPVMPTFHPAYVLRNYTPETRRMVWSDLQAVLGKLRALRGVEPAS